MAANRPRPRAVPRRSAGRPKALACRRAEGARPDELFIAFDLEPGGDPRGPWCPKCKLPVLNGQPAARMTSPEDPDGRRGVTGLWHGECARPYWDKFSHVLRRLGGR